MEGRARLPRARVCKAAEGGGKDRHRILPAAELCRICAGRYPPAQRQNASDPRPHGVHRPPRGGRRQVRRRSPQQKIRRAPPAAGGKEPAPSMRRRAGLSERENVHLPLFSAFGRRGRLMIVAPRRLHTPPAFLRVWKARTAHSRPPALTGGYSRSSPQKSRRLQAKINRLIKISAAQLRGRSVFLFRFIGLFFCFFFRFFKTPRRRPPQGRQTGRGNFKASRLRRWPAWRR